MCLFFILVFCFNLLTFTQCAFDLDISSSPQTKFVDWKPMIIIKNVDEPLNLTCRVMDLEKNIIIYSPKITWSWNITNQKSPLVTMEQNSLIFPSIQRSSAGDYTCSCSEFSLKKSVRIKLNLKKTPYCNDNMFKCSNGNCINKLYMCDGKADCYDRHDESVQYCGADPCQDKLRCEDDRCIPLSWCCDRKVNENCTVKNRPKCCLQLSKLPYDEDELYSYHDHAEDQRKLNDMGFLQTTIYTVVGCAMAFMLVTTLLIVAICRIHTKRAIVTRCPMAHQSHPNARQHIPSQSLSALPLYNLDLFGQESGLTVTYNINNGVQFVGRPVDPPPYSEVVDPPPREGPPPPYVSRENVAQVPQLGDSPVAVPAEGDGCDVSLLDDERKSAHAKNAALAALKRESRSDGNICRTVRCPSEVFSSLKELAVADEGVNIYVNRLCDSKKEEQTAAVKAPVESDDDVESYSENDSLLAPPQRIGSTEIPPQNARASNGKRPMSCVLPKSVLRRGKSIGRCGSGRGENDGSIGGSMSGSIVGSMGGSTASACPDYLQRRSLGDLTPSSESFSFDGEVVTMPLRESFIGVRDAGGK